MYYQVSMDLMEGRKEHPQSKVWTLGYQELEGWTQRLSMNLFVIGSSHCSGQFVYEFQQLKCEKYNASRWETVLSILETANDFSEFRSSDGLRRLRSWHYTKIRMTGNSTTELTWASSVHCSDRRLQSAHFESKNGENALTPYHSSRTFHLYCRILSRKTLYAWAAS